MKITSINFNKPLFGGQLELQILPKFELSELKTPLPELQLLAEIQFEGAV